MQLAPSLVVLQPCGSTLQEAHNILLCIVILYRGNAHYVVNRTHLLNRAVSCCYCDMRPPAKWFDRNSVAKERGEERLVGCPYKTCSRVL